MRHSQLHSKTTSKRQTGGQEILARLVSDLANPLIIPPLVFMAIAYLLSVSAIEMGLITSITFLFFTLIPLVTTLSLLQNGHIQSLDVPERKNRNKLFRYTILSSSIGSILIISLCMGKQPVLVKTALVFWANPIFGYLINRRFKISIHTAALATGGTLLFILFLQQAEMNFWLGIPAFSMLFLLLPLMIWARFRLHVHSLSELYGGAIAGVLLTTAEIGIMNITW